MSRYYSPFDRGTFNSGLWDSAAPRKTVLREAETGQPLEFVIIKTSGERVVMPNDDYDVTVDELGNLTITERESNHIIRMIADREWKDFWFEYKEHSRGIAIRAVKVKEVEL